MVNIHVSMASCVLSLFNFPISQMQFFSFESKIAWNELMSFVENQLCKYDLSEICVFYFKIHFSGWPIQSWEEENSKLLDGSSSKGIVWQSRCKESEHDHDEETKTELIVHVHCICRCSVSNLHWNKLIMFLFCFTCTVILISSKT